ncbi:MAG: hypothetical protein SV375_22840 [Thermodesulfobacteriota bacterium]|nr:hypothetical protein [Thermodesulfobacteriota bacterium]
MGIETIFNLHVYYSDRDEIEETELAYEHNYMKAWHPEEKELVRLLQIVSNPKRTPVFFIAIMEQIEPKSWYFYTGLSFSGGGSKEQILNEMIHGDFLLLSSMDQPA